MRRIIIYGCFFLLLLPACDKKAVDAPEIKYGTLDLSGWDFEDDGVIQLNGNWEFYWNQLLVSQDFKEGNLPMISSYIKVPGNWNKFTYQNTNVKAFGYATYRLQIRGLDTKNPLYIYLKYANTAYRLYIDGNLIMSNGVVGTNQETTVPQYYVQSKKIPVSNDEVEIIIQVANFKHYRGGLLSSIKMGTKYQIKKRESSAYSIDLFLIGSIFIMSLYHFIFVFFRRNEKPALYFGMFCILLAVRTISTNQIFITQLFPNIDYELLIKLQYIPYFLGGYFLMTFVYSVFYDLGNIKLIRYLQYFYLAFSLFALFTPCRIYLSAILLYHINAITGCSYSVIIIIKAVKRNKTGALFVLIGMSLFLLSMINDILYSYNILNTGYLVPFGVLIFLFSQALLLASRSSKTFLEIEDLSLNLEIIIDKRTEELTLTQRELSDKNQKILESINYAANIQNTILPSEAYFEYYFMDHFIIWKPRDIVGGDFYFMERNENSLVIGVADCTGHGVPGALMTTIAKSGIQLIFEDVCNDDPAEILNALNIFIQSQLSKGIGKNQADDGLDIGLCYIDLKKQMLIYSGAKIRLFYFDPNINDIQQINGDKQSVGYISSRLDFIYHNHIIPFQKGMTFYLSSDGLASQVGGNKGFPFGWSKLKKLLIEISNESLWKQKNIITNTLINYQANESQRDDITLIGFQI